MATPSSRRREGRNVFCPGDDPELLCPYLDSSYKEDWLDGWNEMQAECDKEEARGQEEEDEFDSLKYGCPWHGLEFDETCSVSHLSCAKENCAPWYFKSNG